MSSAEAPPLGGGLMYAVDVPRFRDADGDGVGDLAGVLERLDHIASLGTTWLWLLPFYDSPRRDNGYDVRDHCVVDPTLGTLDDVRRLVSAAHERGIRVLIELVAHHTSDEHPWFLAARRDPSSAAARRYVLTDDPARFPAETMFPGEEDGVWAPLGAEAHPPLHYRHDFSDFEPDLNAANPDVLQDYGRIVRFWLDTGVDAFRVDAATLLLDGHGMEHTEPDDDEVLAAIRAGLPAGRGPWLVGEVDRSPAEAAEFVGDARYDAVYDFALSNAFFLALAREDARPIGAVLAEVEEHLGFDRMVNFVRNHDELDLEQLSDDERDEVFARFAPDPSMRIYGRGVRRSWASMLGPERFRMSLSMLMACPGLPVLFSGHEIGLGDDLSVAGRGSVRLAMQWSDAANGGFTTAAESPYVLPAQRTGPLGFREVNVRAQAGAPDSPLALVRDLVRLRTELHADGPARFDVGDDPAVLRFRGAGMTAVHNLSGRRVAVGDAGRVMLERGLESRALGPYGFAWLRS